MPEVRVSFPDVVKGIRVPTGERVTVVVKPAPRDVIVRIDVDPADKASVDDTFRLYSADGSYDRTLTTRDDVKPGDGFVDLHYTGLLPRTSYTLEIDPKDGRGPSNAFENVPYEELVGLSDRPLPEEEPPFTELMVRLDIDPADADSADYTIRLFSSDGAYEQVKTVKDDLTKGDAFVDLKFTDLVPGKEYSLEFDPGAQGEPHLVFENVPFARLAEVSFQHPPADDLDGIGDLRVRLEIDPDDAKSQDDRFTLRSTDGTFTQVKTVKDDLTPGDGWVDLRYTNLPWALSYTLEVDLGKEGGKTLVFEDVPYFALADVSFQPPPPGLDPDADATPEEGSLRVRAELDPAEAANLDDRFILTTADKRYRQVKTVKDDQKPGDQAVDLEFTGLPRDGVFTLEHDPGREGKPSIVFKDVPFGQLAELSFQPPPNEPADDEALPRKLVLRIDAQHLDAAAANDRFTLKAADGSWSQTRSLKDDHDPSDEWVELRFEGFDPTKEYALEVDPGDGEAPFLLFEQVPALQFAELSFGALPKGVTAG